MTVMSTSSTLHIYHMNRLLRSCVSITVFFFPSWEFSCDTTALSGCHVPIRPKVLGEVKHILFLHVFEFSAAFGLEFVDVSPDECRAASSVHR